MEDGLLEVIALAKAVALQDVFDPAVEALDRAIGLRPHWGRQAVLDPEVCAKAVAIGAALGFGTGHAMLWADRRGWIAWRSLTGL